MSLPAWAPSFYPRQGNTPASFARYPRLLDSTPVGRAATAGPPVSRVRGDSAGDDGGAVLSALIVLFSPRRLGHGTDEAIEMVHGDPRAIRRPGGAGEDGGQRPDHRLAVQAAAKHPTAQISAGFCSLLTRWLNLSNEDGRTRGSAGHGMPSSLLRHWAERRGARSPTATTSTTATCRAGFHRPNRLRRARRLLGLRLFGYITDLPSIASEKGGHYCGSVGSG